MTESPLRPIHLHDLTLLPDRVLGAPPVTAHLESRLSFGWDVLPVNQSLMPESWYSYATASAPQRTYCHLILICSFHPETVANPGAITSASLGVSLKSTNAPETPPKARKIDPGKRLRPLQNGPSTGTVNLTARIPGGLAELGYTGQLPQNSDPWIVQGHGESQSTPVWQFRGTSQYPLIGDHPLHALIETTATRDDTAEVLLAAEIQHRRFGIRRYQAQLPPLLSAIPLTSV